MPVDQETHALPSPWKEFLSALDDMLTEPVELHCIGGFVLTLFYGLPRTTGDIDYYTAIPPNLDLDAMAGQGSALHWKHKVWLHRVGVANLPEDYTTRLSETASGQFKRFKISFLTPTTASCPNSSEPARKTGMTPIICSVPRSSTPKCSATDTRTS